MNTRSYRGHLLDQKAGLTGAQGRVVQQGHGRARDGQPVVLPLLVPHKRKVTSEIVALLLLSVECPFRTLGHATWKEST